MRRAPQTLSALTLLAATVVVGSVSTWGCANEDGDGVLAGGTTSGGGGAGGVGGLGGGGAGGESPCAIDCSTIETPPCLTSVCNTGQHPGEVGSCVVVNSEGGTPCDDGLFCTVDDGCFEGECVGGPQNTCGRVAPPCEVITCVESSQSCSTGPAEDGAACIADNLCEVNATCQGGVCEGNPKDCTFSPNTECNSVACNPATGACDPTPDPAKDGAFCALTGDPCMVQKACDGGACLGGVPKNCSAFTNGCNNGLCEPQTGACYADPVAPGGQCFDGVAQCQVGVCSSGGTCDPMPATEGASCNDSNSCTVTDICTAGVCAGSPDPGYTVYFSESFANNTAGWTLGPEWEIGPAVAGPAGNCEDPGTDTSPTADNGIAGVEIGGCSPSSLIDLIHPYYYLTSPVIDTSVAPGAVWLQFYRWLESDYTNFMNNVIEVFDGTTWVMVWQSGSVGIHDAPNWVFVSHDLTAYKNANMQIRFGFNIGSTGVFDEGSWNVDDVLVANLVCQ